jgi:RNA polymerase sigma-70 factor (ECF subfamily)
MLTTSVTLLQRLRQPNEPAAWARFVELYTPVLFAWAQRLGLQDADAADLVQEVFALLLNKLPEFAYDPGKSFRGWLRTVALNHWRATLRRRARTPAGAALDPEQLEAPAEEAFWEEEYRRHLVGRALTLMQAEFQPSTWRACWECVVNDRPGPEVAAELGLTHGAVRAARFRVLARLRQELDGLLE